MTVQGVNQAPTFNLGAAPIVNEDNGAQSIGNFLSGVTAGAGETGQALTLTLVADQPALFSTQPALGSGRPLGIPLPSLVMLAVYAAAHVALLHTRFGRHVLAVGGNAEAARLAGIRTGRVVAGVYVLCGTLSAASGVLLASRMNSGQPNAGLMYELDVIAAVVVGGTSLTGGRGSIAGTFLGAMLIAVLRNGLNLLNVNSYVQQVVVGAVILLAVLADTARKK